MIRPPIDQQVTFLATRDLEVTATFYEEVLQLPLILDQRVCRIYRVGRQAFLGFCSHLPWSAEPKSLILTLVSSEVDAWYDYLRKKGILLGGPPVHNPTYNIYHFFFRDPDGYLIEVQRFLDPAWPGRETVD